MFHLAFLGAFFCLPQGAPAQNALAPPPVPAATPDAEPLADETEGWADPLVALSSLHESIQSLAEQTAAVSDALATANAAEQEGLQNELKALISRRDDLMSDFESIATGVDPGEYDRSAQAALDLKNELTELLRPIVDELKGITARPREIEELRTDRSVWQGRRDLAERALSQLDRLPGTEDADLAAALGETREKWAERHQLAENRLRALSYQLEQAERDQPSFYEAARDGLRTFFRTRGLNFLLSALAFLGAFLLLRYLHRRVQTHAPWMRGATRPFYARLIDVALALFSLVGALAASLFVLYATGDWVLMGIAIILLIGLALAARTGLPRIYEDARLLLNLGEIREGERVVYEGLPWRVESLNFFSILKNEKLRGGILRLPVRRLSGMISRPLAEGEFWFPTTEGDWIDLPDRGKGRIVSQTPEWVQLVQLGGARITMPTDEFLEAAPTNLSLGFRLSTHFGISYRHQAESTTRIPEILQAKLNRELVSMLEDHAHLRSVRVEFASASDSSLDYAIIADFDGRVAARYEFLRRALQRIAVDCCNEQGWEIPFPQLTVHRAEGPDRAGS